MKSLLYKEFHLVIHPLFYLVLLCGALLLIPQWVYFVAVMYFFFITLPNIFTMSKAQNDIGFSAMLPVRRQDIVKARMGSVIILEGLQILVTAVFAVINMAIYPKGNSLMDPNVAFIGFVFILYGIFNVIFFPMFYKTADKIGIPVIVAMAAATLFGTAVEFLIAFVPALRVFDSRGYLGPQLAMLAGGIILYGLLNVVAYRKSTKNFDSIDL
jgi:hypothetical protein